MKKIILNAEPREKKEVKDLTIWVKGIVYGPEMKESKSIWFMRQEFKRVYNEVGGSTLVDLKINGDDQDYSILFHDMQYNGLTDELMHVDFYKVKMGEKIDTTIELNFVGEAPAVKEQGGILIKGYSSLEVRCFPRHLVGEIEVNLEKLKEIEDCIYVKELNIPAEIEVITSLDASVASVAKARTAEELEGLDEKVEMDVDQVEVEKGKSEEADEEESEGDDKAENKDQSKVKETKKD